MKNKVLIVFKYPRANWNPYVIKKFSNYYETEHLYISEYKNKNFTEIVKDINELIEQKNIQIVVFDVDYFKFINSFFIEKINSKKKILWTGDDFELHEMHAITASSCDIVLSHCPLSVLKYREKGYKAHVLHGVDGKINKSNHIKKEIDVLFFGYITPDRKEILDYIVKEGISLKNVGHEDHIVGLPKEELLKLISKSKIVLDLSKSKTSSVTSFTSENIYKFYYQMKGKVVEAGLNGAACVSEYSPSLELLFNEEELPIFYTKEECVKILKKLLYNDELLSKYKNKFTLKACSLFEDKKTFEPIYNAIEKMNHKRVQLIKFPYWYLRIIAKQILLRNIKLSSLIKSILQFKLIFEVIKSSNFLIKLLIIFESIFNTFWYSFAFTLKHKR